MMVFGWSSGLTPARQARPRHAELCTIVQYVVLLHRMWCDGSDFRWSKQIAA
jgi:hypothetical protein